ncbi:XcyI family restriction endonuclease [Paracoccus yeei]|uniref:XcyI family restriction endonuclease n=1 Tax=Paracoccus yeei TaxID=147645 RepID=UPI003BF8AD7D
MSKFSFAPPDLQVDFARKLNTLRPKYLQQALAETINGLDITKIDSELAKFVPGSDLSVMAAAGLRAELIFAVPSILQENPELIGYYRLLLGYSQKQFYGRDSGFGVGHFKSMEEKGRIGATAFADIEDMCEALCAAASQLLRGLKDFDLEISKGGLEDLSLLTLGPQLRGGANNSRGSLGITQVFDVIEDIVGHARLPGEEEDTSRITVKSATGRSVIIRFAADPDIVIQEEVSPGKYLNAVAIEVKSGTDASNIHNRIGEAEKSHQKARREGYAECWTVINVGGLDMDKAYAESPTTNHFFTLANLIRKEGQEFENFRSRLLSAVSIAAKPEN